MQQIQQQGQQQQQQQVYLGGAINPLAGGPVDTGNQCSQFWHERVFHCAPTQQLRLTNKYLKNPWHSVAFQV
jgi:hypothetical protein